MKFLDLVKPEAVKVVSTASSKKRLMQDIAALAESAYGLPSGPTVEALMEREALGPTGVGEGVALPHARLRGLDKVVGVFILLDKPVPFDSVDRQPVDLVCALFAPEDAGVEHLKALALVSRSLRDAKRCSKLRANPDPGTIYTILTETEAEKAA
ncbi:PTS sugar transporter subunit IIA [Allosediminivita pacifica]|uniref:Phosphotransferase IIA-like nitrogen-regulatory protein PtsN n=1 Tax=Allosediminivita pacifica TaxID=1267769 RepID=A0A2T6B431_9RHOB|nr:PTS sugar transporter subunit IIA [Allosediminivita pacifica]PTX50837.1 phosphotransferase IIA-like nitrogen-regulatory protein PtsN [Allosediminivita pacifica]GGB01560.1 PTS lactose transporter subunit IIC [Allosediminivita pacifica]